MRAGDKGGVDFALDSLSVDLPTDSSPSRETSFVVGAAFEASAASAAEGLSLQLEALYVRRKTTVAFSSADGLPGVAAEYKVDWLDVPFTVKYAFQPEPFEPFIFGGV